MAMVTVASLPWMLVPVGVQPVARVDNGVSAPITMGRFPAMKARQPNRIECNPQIARPQIKIPIAEDTNVFVAIPDIRIRNRHRYHRSRNLHRYCGRRNLHYYGRP